MPNDISLPAIAAVRAGSSSAAEPRTPATEPAQAVPAAAPPVANPTLRLDAALGLVVIEFRNDSGEITTSIPSERQLQEYQRWEQTKLGPAPDGESRARSQEVSASVTKAGTAAAQPSDREEAKPSGR
jgi:hypothetical protein